MRIISTWQLSRRVAECYAGGHSQYRATSYQLSCDAVVCRIAHCSHAAQAHSSKVVNSADSASKKVLMPDQVPEFVCSVCCEVMAFTGAGSCCRYWMRSAIMIHSFDLLPIYVLRIQILIISSFFFTPFYFVFVLFVIFDHNCWDVLLTLVLLASTCQALCVITDVLEGPAWPSMEEEGSMSPTKVLKGSPPSSRFRSTCMIAHERLMLWECKGEVPPQM